MKKLQFIFVFMSFSVFSTEILSYERIENTYSFGIEERPIGQFAGNNFTEVGVFIGNYTENSILVELSDDIGVWCFDEKEQELDENFNLLSISPISRRIKKIVLLGKNKIESNEVAEGQEIYMTLAIIGDLERVAFCNIQYSSQLIRLVGDKRLVPVQKSKFSDLLRIKGPKWELIKDEMENRKKTIIP